MPRILNFRNRPDPLQSRLSQLKLTEALLSLCADILIKPITSNAVQQVCDEIAGHLPAIKLVWTWFGAANAPIIRPQAFAGKASMYAHTLAIDTSKISSISPVFDPIHGRKGKIYPVSEQSVYDNWRESSRSHGVRSVFAVPLAAENASEVGVMVLYADEANYFQRMGTALFDALGYFTGAILSKQVHERALSQMAYYDSLTGQLNRNGLYKALKAKPTSGYCVMLDIDHFKVINDTYGHSIGDVVLSRLGSLINRRTLRLNQWDTHQSLNFYAARWGGEEFFIFVSQATQTQVVSWVERLREAMSALDCPISTSHNIHFTASFGIAYCPDSHSMLRSAIKNADAALYQAKANGRNCCVIQTHTSSLDG